MQEDSIVKIVVAVIGTIGVISAAYLTYRSRKQVHDGSVETKQVRYRDVIKLMHVGTGYALHSHKKNYTHPGTSGQQQVTAYAGANSDDYWIVKSQHGYDELKNAGRPVRHDDVIRLEHQNTRMNLHSHGDITSPVSNQQEVTAFGIDGIGDTNDNWRVNVESGRVWTENTRVRLIHLGTRAALHSHRGASHSEYTSGQQEVTCFKDRDDNDWWKAIVIQPVDIE